MGGIANDNRSQNYASAIGDNAYGIMRVVNGNYKTGSSWPLLKGVADPVQGNAMRLIKIQNKEVTV